MSLSIMIKSGACALAFSALAVAAYAQSPAGLVLKSGARPTPSATIQTPTADPFGYVGPIDTYPGATGDTRSTPRPAPPVSGAPIDR